MTAKEAILKTRYEHIYLIAANATLQVMNMSLLTHYKDRQDNILYNSLKDIAGNYDIRIIDTPPDSNIPVLNGLFLTDAIIAITLPNTYGLDGIKHLETELTNYNKNLDISAKIKGVVINQFTSTPPTYRIMDELREQYKILPTIKAGRMAIKRLNECINQQKSIYELSPNSGFTKDLKKVIKSIVKG